MPARINVTTIPFRSSRLAVPPSPFSPLVPITPAPLKRTFCATADVDLIQHFPPPARKPMQWLWVCHICHRQYNLSVTRRCLEDGHLFCAGTSVVRSRKDGSKKLRRHKACSSEFDYAGWKEWGVWKRNLLVLTEQQKLQKCDSVFEDDDSEDDAVDEISPPITPGTFNGYTESREINESLLPKKDCWNRCDYPSECRWGKQFGVATPLQSAFPTLARVPSTPNPNPSPEFVGVDMAPTPTLPVKSQTFKDILTAEQQQVVAETIDGVESEDNTKAAFTPTPALADLANLISRAQKRHSRTEIPASPLAAVERPVLVRSSSREALRRAVEGGIGAIAGFMGGWRSNSAPPVGRRKEEVEDEDFVMNDVQSGRRKSFG